MARSSIDISSSLIDDGWKYDEGTDEAALLNNIKHPEYEQIGKIYYIQSYMNAGAQTQYSEGATTVRRNVPYKVIGINHDGTTNTIDLMSCVAVNYLKWNDSYNSWKYGKYSTSKLYDWLPNTCPNGYSANIQAKMLPMIERWREAISYTSGTLQTRSTKVKLLNPIELFGDSITTYDPDWEYASTSDHKIKFLYDDYGTQYQIWSNSIGSLASRRVYHEKDMSTTSVYWTNSWLAFRSSINYTHCFAVDTDGSCGTGDVTGAYGVVPVIRLSSESL
jgi:hypothetical protein